MNKGRKYESFIILAAILWGIIGISVTGLSSMGISRVGIVFVRSMVAFLTLGVYLLIKDRSVFKIRIRDLWCFFGTGVVSLMFFNLCYFTAMRETSLAISAILLYTSPAFVMILSAILFKEKITTHKTVSLIFMFVGCVLVTGVFNSENKVSVLGILCGLGSGFGYALYSIFSRFAINKGYKSETISFYTFAFAGFGSGFFADAAEISQAISMSFLAYALLIGVICCTLPYIFYTKGMEGTDNGKASVLAMAEPLVAAVVSVFLDGVPSIYRIIGMIIMLGAILYINKI